MLFAAACVSIALTRAGDGLAVLWLPNAMLLSFVLLRFRAEAWSLIASGMVATLAANLLFGHAAAAAAALAIANAIDVVVALALLRRFLGDRPDFTKPPEIFGFLAIVTFASTIGGAMGAAAIAMPNNAPFLPLWGAWISGDALAMAIITPAVVVFRPGSGHQPLPHDRRLSFALHIILIAILTAIGFVPPLRPLLFLLFPPLLAVAYSFGVRGAVLSVAVVALIGTVSTASSDAPLNIAHDRETQVRLLQLFFAALLISALTLGGLIERSRRLAARLTESEERYRGVVDNVGEVIFQTDVRGRWTFLNPAFERLTHVPIEDALGTSFLSYVGEEDRQIALDNLAPLYARILPTCTQQLRIRRPDGAVRWVEVTSELMLDQSDAIVGTAGAIRDVTARYLAEEALTASERRFRILAQTSPAVILRTDAAGQTTFVNRAWRVMTGMAEEDALGMGWLAAIPPDDRAALIESWSANVAARRSSEREGRFLRADGTEGWFAISFEPEIDETGAIDGYVGVAIDITASKQAEIALAESETRFRLLAENASDMVLHVAIDGTCLYASPAAERLLGYTPEQLVGSNLASFFHPDDTDTARRAHAAVVFKGEPTATVEYRARDASGAWRWFESSTRGWRNDQDEIQGAITVVRDVAHRKVLEAELLTARDAAEAAARAKASFLAMMSHEIRTPMTGMLGMLELLDKASSAERPRFEAALKGSARSLKRVLDDVLDFSRLDAVEIVPEPVAFDLEAKLASVADLFRGSLAPSVTLDIACGPAGLVLGDAARIRQVLTNLVGNAAKFTPAGAIRVTAAPLNSGAVWRFEVTDTGPGIAPDVLGRLFEPFVQAEPHHQRGGTGLGLAICKRIVDGLGGRIGVAARAGKGSTFWFELELPPALPEVCPANDQAPAATRPLDILVAEDNETSRLLIEAMLARLGHRVRCVGDGAFAVEAVRARPFDLVLMDMHMPGMNGPEATRAIRALGRERARTPIWALTADAVPENHMRYEQAGLDGLLLKPFSSGDLARVIATAEGLKDATDRRADLIETLGPEALARLERAFTADLRDRLPVMTRFAEARDWVALREQAHSVKGAAAGIGLSRCAILARRIEDCPDGSDAAELLAELGAAAGFSPSPIAIQA